MEAVHVLVRGDEVDDLVRADPFRKGQLDEDAVEPRVPVEAVHHRQDLLLRGVGGHADRLLEDADLLGAPWPWR